jgi:hypothetical protein
VFVRPQLVLAGNEPPKHCSELKSIIQSIIEGRANAQNDLAKINAPSGERPRAKISDISKVLSEPGSQQFIKRFSKYDGIKAEDNKQFMRIMQRDLSGNSGHVYFETENAILKELNDSVVRDKKAVDALFYAYQRILMQNVMQDPELAVKLVSKYADYKSVRFMFLRNVDAKALQRVYQLSAKQYEELVTSTPLKALFMDGRGIVQKPGSWYLAGIGETADEAGLAARSARQQFRQDVPITAMQNFNTAKENLAKARAHAETLRRLLQRTIKPDSGVMEQVAGTGKQYVLSPDAIELLRKVDAKDQQSYIHEVMGKFVKRFGVMLSSDQVLWMRDYFRTVDGFMPGNFYVERTLLPIADAEHGVISADFAGQGARNIYAIMAEMQKTANKPIEESLIGFRKAYDAATDDMHSLNRRFAFAVKKVLGDHSGTDVFFSGDDGIVVLKRPLTVKEKVMLTRELGGTPGSAKNFRITFLPAKYVDTMTDIPPAARSRLIVGSESVEKMFRKTLEGTISRQQFNNLTVSIEVEPHSNDLNKINIVVSGRVIGNEMENVQEAIRQAVKRTLPTQSEGRVDIVLDPDPFYVPLGTEKRPDIHGHFRPDLLRSTVLLGGFPMGLIAGSV